MKTVRPVSEDELIALIAQKNDEIKAARAENERLTARVEELGAQVLLLAEQLDGNTECWEATKDGSFKLREMSAIMRENDEILARVGYVSEGGAE